MSQQCIEANRIKPLRNPAYNPDYVPNDFFLFGRINRKLPEFHENPPNERKTVIAEILHRIGEQIPVAMFMGQTRRL
jgi:hypothetical protein